MERAQVLSVPEADRPSTAGLLTAESGPLLQFAATQQFSRFRSEADIQRAALTEPDL